MKELVIVIVTMTLLLTACHLIELNMVNRTVLDQGDGTSDSVTSREFKQESDEMKLIVPFK